MMMKQKYTHDDVIKWKHFPRYWPFVWGIHLSPVNCPTKVSDAERLNKRFRKQSWGWWLETPLRPLWRHCSGIPTGPFGLRRHGFLAIETAKEKTYSMQMEIITSIVTLYVLYNNDVIMSAIASQITGLMIIYSAVYSGADQRKHQSSSSLAFLRGMIGEFPHKCPVTRNMLPFDDVIMKLFTASIKVCTIHIIPPYWRDAGSWNPFSRKQRTNLFYIENVMGADVLATIGARASATMFTMLHQNKRRQLNKHGISLHSHFLCYNGNVV